MMLAHVMTVWMAVAVGQSAPPAEAAWLKVVPADAEIVFRVRGVEGARDDMLKMLQAMSPTLADAVKPSIEQGVATFTQQYGEPATKTPFISFMHLPKPDAAGQGAPPPLAIIVKSDNYEGVLKSVAGGGNAKPTPKPGGYDSIAGPDGQTIYSVKGSGWVGFGTDEKLIGAVAKPTDSLDKKLNADLRDRFLGGDVGLYVDLAAIQDRFGDQIQQFRQTLAATIEQGAAGQAPNPGQIEQAKSSINMIFDALKNGGGLALNFDFATDGLTLNGQTTVRPGTSAAERKTTTGGDAALLAKLPADALLMAYMKLDAESVLRLQKMGIASLGGEGKLSPEMKRLLEMQKDAGPQEAAVAFDMGAGGMRSIGIINPSDPKKYMEIMQESMKAAKTQKSPGMDMIKDVKIETAAEKYKGFTFDRTTMTFDLKKLAEAQPNNPNAEQSIRAMLGDGKVTTWTGTDGKLVLTITARDFDAAKAMIDSALSGQGTLGSYASFKSVRSRFPDQVNTLFLLSTQGLTRTVVTNLATATNNKDLKVPSDLPKEPALAGLSTTGTKDGTAFRVVVPSQVGPVIEKGLLPAMQAAGGQVAR